MTVQDLFNIEALDPRLCETYYEAKRLRFKIEERQRLVGVLEKELEMLHDLTTEVETLLSARESKSSRETRLEIGLPVIDDRPSEANSKEGT